MKASSIALLLFASTAATTLAQTSQVPELLSYQASVTNAAGTPIGATEPVNRTVTFKFYTTSTGGTPVYAESQVVTIANGDFSVLLGNGEGVKGLPGRVLPASPIRSLTSITLSPLYLGITVDDGTAAVDAEISPRQELASSAFATRAQIAEGLADGKLATDMVADSAITTVKIGSNQVTTAKIADSNITSAKLATGSVTLDKLDTSAIGIWTPNGSNINRTSGNVGIGEPSPGFPLNFASTTGNKIALYGNSGAHYGLGTQSDLLQLYTSASSADVAFGYGSSTAFTETMRIKGNGNLGIGTKTPSSKLHVVGGSATIDSASATALSILQDGGTGKLDLAVAGGTGSWSSSAATNDGILRAMTGKLHLQTGSGAAGITVDAANNVGMGTTTPSDKLTVAGNVLCYSLHANSKRTTHAQGAHLEWNKVSGTGATYVLNQKGQGSGGFIFGEVTTADIVTERMRIDGDGRIRIGTIEKQGLLNVGSVTASYFKYGHLDTDGGHSSNSQQDNVALSIYTTGRIFTQRVDITSDQRIKTDFSRSDSEADLNSLMQIEVTDYAYRDALYFGTGKEKKVVAQQIETVLPQAVTIQRGVIPDIYRIADVDQGWVTISGKFQIGERLRVIASDEINRTLEILATRDGAVLLDLEPELREVFVYGREVDDLRSVDYDALAMLNVSATQELNRKISKLEGEAAEKEDTIESLSRRLEAVEKLISGNR